MNITPISKDFASGLKFEGIFKGAFSMLLNNSSLFTFHKKVQLSLTCYLHNKEAFQQAFHRKPHQANTNQQLFHDQLS